MSATTSEILTAKTEAGNDAYLWLHSSGDCLLWANEKDSENDDGARAVGRWSLDSAETEELIASGEVDDIA